MKYNITIKYNSKKNSQKMIEFDAPYFDKKEFTDKIQIFSDKVLIQGNRTKNIELNEIANLYKSTLYTQIIKAIIFFQIRNKGNAKIDSIEISSTKTTKRVFSEEILLLEIKDKEVLGKINERNLHSLFDYSIISKTLMSSVYYLLQGISSPNPSHRFEFLWKAFNILYVYHAQTTTDFECLKKMKQFMLNHSAYFSNSIAIAKKMNSTEFRNNFRWRNLVLNDYDTINKTKAYRDFIFRYSDHRIMTLFKEIECYRKDFLTIKGYYNEVNNHIYSNISARTNNEIELVSLIILKYCYFLRNKYFHGEYNENFYQLFKIGKNDDEFNYVNKLLSVFIVELINAINLL